MQLTFASKSVTLARLAAVGALATTASAQIGIYPSNTAFTDISATGTSPGSASDDSEVTVTGAALTGAGFAGNELLGAVDIRIGNNGSVIWNPVAAPLQEVGYINSTTLPTMAASNLTTTGNAGTAAGQQMVCPLWDDHFPSSGQAANALDWQVIGGNLYIQWSSEDHFNATGTGTTQFQMVVYGGVTIASRQPLVEFIYNDTLYAAGAYQNDGGSATVGYKNWGVVANANDVEYGTGGGTNTIGDPAFGDPSMQPKVGGWVANNDPTLTHSVVIRGGSLPMAYCTCGTSTNGCCATISATANPNVAHSNVCVINVTNVEGQKSGILFYGLAPSSAPWCATSSSLLCVKAPTQRAGSQNSGGTAGACDGTMTLDWNAWQLAHPGALGQVWVAFNQAYVQAWYRDPPACKTTNLSNALKLTYQP